MTILLDNCVPRRYLRLIQEWGYSATYLSSHIASDSADADVMALATRLDAVLLTVDLDFANILDYPPGRDVGIIVLRYTVQEETILDTTLKSALDDMYRDDLRDKLVINIGRQLSSAKLELKHPDSDLELVSGKPRQHPDEKRILDSMTLTVGGSCDVKAAFRDRARNWQRRDGYCLQGIGRTH